MKFAVLERLEGRLCGFFCLLQGCSWTSLDILLCCHIFVKVLWCFVRFFFLHVFLDVQF